uniref:Uncharacterized protein n=1 Tax=Anguilla anguilla TaxID=7936 RepID=A0A0E9QIH8_ANGAN
MQYSKGRIRKVFWEGNKRRERNIPYSALKQVIKFLVCVCNSQFLL